jgi:hypothetical protein
MRTALLELNEPIQLPYVALPTLQAISRLRHFARTAKPVSLLLTQSTCFGQNLTYYREYFWINP